MTDDEKQAKREQEVEALTGWLENYFHAVRVQADRDQIKYIASKALIHIKGGSLVAT